jgi:hypothetical protein
MDIYEAAEKIFKAVDDLYDYVLDHLSLIHYNPEGKFSIDVPIAENINELLNFRFDEEQNEEKRFLLFDVVRACFQFKLNDIQPLLNEKINFILPVKSEYNVESIDLFDDPELELKVYELDNLVKHTEENRCLTVEIIIH